MDIFAIETNKERESIDLTDKINEVISHNRAQGEMCHLFVRHTTAALTTVYIDPKREMDLIGMMEAVLPHSMFAAKGEKAHTYVTTYLPPDILASFVGATLAIPVKEGKLMLGNFQRVVLLEFSGPGKREIVIVED